MIAAMPNRVRNTVLGAPPLSRQLSPIQPPTSSPTKPAKKMMKEAPPSALMSKPCTLNR